ncbi:hypothetical protein HMPREF9440_02411 [Sutterella parvirubra YIT 11816]|uniref:Uncharacterized protein n=1 Tax=Sutterella parvirubra YIT 11816 TaxID=762967 RepID=H3KI09_9BURK|nr:hypothetical protein HMPREF9440_02411 [Sutterella parvirubra YIT 11816]
MFLSFRVFFFGASIGARPKPVKRSLAECRGGPSGIPSRVPSGGPKRRRRLIAKRLLLGR